MGASPPNSETYIDDVNIAEVSSKSLANGGFESFGTAGPQKWNVVNHSNGSFSITTNASNVHKGNSALKAAVNSTGKAFNLQIESPNFNTNKGKTYKVTFWIKASTSGCQYQIEGRSGGNTDYSGEKSTPTSYTQESYTFTADGSTSSITFDMGDSPANSKTYIDDVVIVEASSNNGGGQGTAAQDSAAVASFMKKYITKTVSHYKGKVNSWDVVNEPLDGSGNIRSNPNLNKPTKGGIFYWDQYIGDQYIPMAFKYAHQADPDAKLYINDYNLASDATKLNALVDLVNQLKKNNVPIDGIGAEMHININTSHSGIDHMFQRLASTGLLIRISELDIRINPKNNKDFKLTNSLLIDQQRMYNYVVYSYIQNVPKSQRSGITVWNLIDNGSWIVVNQGHIDYPTLFNKNYQKKPAFSGLMEGLLDRQPDY
jgi:endo-1,4-beta-xylanase